jgi:hypothetical protein
MNRITKFLKGGYTMKQWSWISVGLAAVLVFAAATAILQAVNTRGEMLEYEVISIDANNWVVTAKETATGNVVKFRLPPTAFNGQTFDADLENLQIGRRFSVRGPRNARLNNLVMERPLAKRPHERREVNTPRMTLAAEKLTWEIVTIDPNNWIVTARNRNNRKMVKVKAHPEAFTGFRFRANLEDIGNGEGFSIVTPNDRAMSDCCTLLEMPK